MVLGELAEQHVGDDEPEHRVAEELERLVVEDAAARVLVRARPVRQRVLEQPAVVEAVADAAARGSRTRGGCGTTTPFGSVLRWLSIRRAASSAVPGGTAIRVSPCASTLNGNTECGASDDRTTGMPWASRSPHTTVASMSEDVRKMTASRT